MRWTAVLTDLTGQLVLEDGTARFADLSFGVPGAASRLHGTYNLISHKIDLHGQLQVDTKMSNTPVADYSSRIVGSAARR